MKAKKVLDWLVYTIGTGQVSAPVTIDDRGETVIFQIPLNNQKIERIEVPKKDFNLLKNQVSGRRDWED